MAKQVPWTGERLETFVYNDATIEHLHRYAIAKELVHNKVVLDIACGEGYGTNLLAASAEQATGVDVDGKIIDHASKKYRKDNLSFKQGTVEKIPFDSATFDVVICFETLEHTTEHELALKEFKRVLKPGGLLLISTPDKKKYSDLSGYKNPFHARELYRHEFEQLLSGSFKYIQYTQQRLVLASLIVAETGQPITLFEGSFTEIKETPLDALYLIALASDSTLPDTGTSAFISEATLETAIENKINDMKNTASYRIGHIILLPFKLVRNLFRKQKSGGE